MLGKKVAPEEPSLYPFIVFGQSHARFPPPALPGLLTAHQLLFLLGSGEWGLGAGVSFPACGTAGARCHLLLCPGSCPLSSEPTGERDHPSSVRVEGGDFSPRRMYEVCMDEASRCLWEGCWDPFWVGVGRAQRRPQGALVSPLQESLGRGMPES